MAEKTQKSLFQEMRAAVAKAGDAVGIAPAEPPEIASAMEEFLLGEGVERPVPPPPPDPHATLWMLGPMPGYQRKIAFTDSVGGRLGDIGLTTRFLLNGWSQTPAGFRWTLDPGAPEVPVISERAQDILKGCFVRTTTGLGKLAAAEYGGDMEAAIIHAINEQMDMLGLDRYIPEEAPHG